MPGSSNPLAKMALSEGQITPIQSRPHPSFAETVLPGFKTALKARRAVRAFDDAPVPEEIMRDCLRDAVLAPSASNLQSYTLHWVRDAVLKQQMPQYCLDQPAVKSAAEIVVVVARTDLWRAHLDDLTAIMTKDGTVPLPDPMAEYYETTVPMLMTTDRFGFHNLKRRIMFWLRGLTGPTVSEPVCRVDHRVYGAVQAAMAAQTLMLSVAAHGYESCPIGGIDKPGIAHLLGLPSGAEVTMVIAVGRGRPEGVIGPRIRLPYDALVKEM